MTGPPDFDRLYRGDPDPWQVGSSPYEQRKLGLVVACLAEPHYGLAWDPACGTGHLAQRLAGRCDRVLASDASPEAVQISRGLLADEVCVEVLQHRLPAAPPTRFGTPDLVVLSEVFYYLDDRDRADTLGMIDDVAGPTAELVAVHWRHVLAEARLGGAGAQQEITSRLLDRGWRHLVHHVDDEFVIDSLRRSRSPR